MDVKLLQLFTAKNKVIIYALLFILLMFALVLGSCEIAARKTVKSKFIPLCGENQEDDTEIRKLHEEAVFLITSGHYKEAGLSLKEIITFKPEFYGAYRTLGEILSRYINTETIGEFLHELVKQHPDNGYAYWALGLLGTEQKNYDIALDYFRQAVTLIPEFYDAYENLVDIYKMQGKIQEAAPLLESYFLNLQKGGFADAEYGLAYLCYSLGKMDDAFNLCEKLCSGSVPLSAGRLYKLTGTLYSIKRQSLTASNYYECALAAFRAYGDKQGEMAALINLGITYDQLVNYETALEKYRQALPLAKLLRNNVYEGLLLMNTGLAYQNLDDYSKSFEYYHQALAYFRKMEVPNKEVLIYINNNLGQLHEFLADFSRARDYYDTALGLSREIKRQDHEVAILNNLGEVYKEQMDFDNALDSYARALNLMQDKNDPWTKAVILNNIGEIHTKTGGFRQAADTFAQSLEYRKQTGDRRGEGITCKNTGYLFYLKGDYTEALHHYRKALKLTAKESAESAEITGEMGICYHALKQYDRAFEYLKKSIEISEAIRGRLKYGKHKTGFMKKKRHIYNAIVELVYTLKKGRSGKQEEYLAFEYGEKAKAWTLLNLLDENKVEVKKGVPPELAARRAGIDREYNLKNSQLQEELKKPVAEGNQALLKRLERDLENLENEYEDILTRAAVKNPRYEQITYTRPVSPVQIRRDLPDASTLILSYLLTEKALFTWCIGKDTFLFLRQPLEQKELEEKIIYLHHLLAKPSKDYTYLESSSELYTLLIKPVLPPDARYNKLIIIPDGILHYLPFEVLVSEEKEEQDTPAYLVREYCIQYVQSATIFHHLLGKDDTEVHNRPARADLLLAVGDPALNTGIHNTAFTGYDTGTIFSPLFSLVDLKPLPGSGREIRDIGKLFPGTLTLSGMDAQEERIKQPDALNDYTCIHFATHCIINEENPLMSGLVLAQDDDPLEDGFLQVREIFNLETRADLVVLSACKTRLGEYIEGEGITGLTHAWMYAGASSVIASLFSIQDESASVFMSEFYRNVKTGMTYADALRQTRLFMMEQDRFRHPYFWAGFVLTGKDRVKA